MQKILNEKAEWLGAVPENWEFYRAKYIFSQRNEKGNDIELQLLSPTQHFGVIPQSMLEELTTANVVKVKDDTDLSTFKTIHKGDYCISLRSFQGGFEYSEYEGVVSPAYQVFYPIKEICDRFYKYLFKANCFINEMNSHTMSLRDGKNIAFDDFGNTYIPYPPIEEQIAIADYLDLQCGKVQEIADELQHQMDTLEKYRQSLVFDCVTGKKDI